MNPIHLGGAAATMRDALPLGIDSQEDKSMNTDRIVGAAKQVKGAIKETVGTTLGDAKLTAEGKSDKIEGKIQNAIGGVKDTLKE